MTEQTTPILRKAESQHIEFKEQWRDDILKTVCAFANTGGGIVYLGLDDKGRSVVLKDTKKLLEDIPNKIRDILGIVADIKIVKKVGKPVIKVTVKKYTAPISYRGVFYIRSGSTTSELKNVELSRFLLSRAGTTWDNVVESKATFDDINIKAVRYFQQLARKRFPFIAKEKSIRFVLQKLNLVEKNKPKRAAILLFGKNPREYFTSAFIQIGRFVSESEVISTDVIEGNLFEQVEKTLEILRVKYLENRFYYEGIYRKEDLVYPEDALREAVINAVIHRDYMGPHTQLRVYEGKLWLWNPGKLPDEITLDKLKKPHSSYPRNELLADIFFKAGFIEAWGRGTLKILDQCRERKLPEPEFSEMSGGFLVTFTKAPAGSKLPKGAGKTTQTTTQTTTQKTTQKQKQILQYLTEHPEAGREQIACHIKGITVDGVKHNLRSLQKKGLLRRIGPDKGGRWEILK